MALIGVHSVALRHTLVYVWETLMVSQKTINNGLKHDILYFNIHFDGFGIFYHL